MYSISPELFERQLKMLSKKFKIISVQELVERIRSNNLGKEDYATVTFDDGLEDNYTNAFPILQKLSIPATIFIITDLIGKVHTNPSGFESRFISWEHARSLCDSGLVSIESHTHTHPYLTTIPNQAIQREVSNSKSLIKKELGHVSKILAYPKGDFDERVIKNICPTIDAAFGPSGVLLKGEQCDVYAIPRVILSKKIGLVKYYALLHPISWRIKRLCCK
ncbi:MAG: polysaccharide deacetylase family protein [Candidatus Nomurabacteria bacterium]|nr:MAG: polysaccharide deacetylase family protein [Candidatus Nomurabacteria bacterium]